MNCGFHGHVDGWLDLLDLDAMSSGRLGSIRNAWSATSRNGRLATLKGNFAFEPGIGAAETADRFGVHLNSVEQWRRRWNKLGLAGLYLGRHTGRPRK
jgi:hypothetical protein